MTDKTTADKTMKDANVNDLLMFEPPSLEPTGWETAEAQMFRFPQRYLAKCQEFNDYAKGLAALEKEKNHLFGFVVRNLISAMDTIEFVAQEIGVSEQQGRADEPIDELEEESAEVAADDTSGPVPVEGTEREAEALEDGEMTDAEQPEDDELAAIAADSSGEVLDEVTSMSRRGVASVRRSLLAILEGLSITPVDLIGKTYRSVEVDGRIVEDPFEIVESRGEGKATDLPVQEVVMNLWVQTEPGLRIIRKGQVVC